MVVGTGSGLTLNLSGVWYSWLSWFLPHAVVICPDWIPKLLWGPGGTTAEEVVSEANETKLLHRYECQDKREYKDGSTLTRKMNNNIFLPCSSMNGENILQHWTEKKVKDIPNSYKNTNTNIWDSLLTCFGCPCCPWLVSGTYSLQLTLACNMSDEPL